MPYFKNAKNDVYWLDDGDDPAVWLTECTPITDDEAKELLVAFLPTPPEPQPEVNPVDKLKAFLAANPDVAALM